MSQQSQEASAALQFLQQVLQVIRENNADTEVVYTLFNANTDKLNDNFPDILRDWLTTRFEQAQPDEAESIATDIFNFGNEIVGFPRGSKASNVEIAIACYETVLKFFTREALPDEWAMTQMNLGTAYRDRINGDKADNIEQAIIAYQQALQVRTRKAFPQEYAQTLTNLGITYQDDGRFSLAYDSYKSAIATVELLRGEIVSSEESTAKQAEEWNELYRRMVFVCLQLGKDSEAVEYIERSNTSNLVELLFNHELSLKGETSPEDNQKLQQLRNKIAQEKQRLQ